MPPKRTSSRTTSRSQSTSTSTQSKSRSRPASKSQSQSQSRSHTAADADADAAATDSFEEDALADVPVPSSRAHPPPPPPPLVPSVHPLPLVESYTWRSPIPPAARGVPCILGVDEAGRGPVLGPLVYGIAYCPTASADRLAPLGFTDSKALTSARRDALLAALISAGSEGGGGRGRGGASSSVDPHSTSTSPASALGLGLGWATRTLSPQDISAGMLRRRPVNLNTQSTEATIALIAGVLAAGVRVEDIYVDTVGDPRSYERTLRGYFPQYPAIRWTVTSKADAIYPVVGAASIAAKVTRDRWVEGWRYAEGLAPQGVEAAPASKKRKRPASSSSASALSPHAFWHTFGSGYPGDPSTVSFLQRTLDPVFGWPGVVRFSWATVKTLLDDKVRVAQAQAQARGGGPAAGRNTRAGAQKALKGDVDTDADADADADAGAVQPEREDAAQPQPQPQPHPQPTLTPTGSLPPAVGQTRGYKVKWMDEPASISTFFGGGGGSARGGTAAVGSMAIAGTGAGAGAGAGAGVGAARSRFWAKSDEALRRERRGIAREVGIASVGPGGL